MIKELLKLDGVIVSIWTGNISNNRTSFECAICICGILEKHESDNKFRILLDEGTYCYFEPFNVVEITFNPYGFKDGSFALIKINPFKNEID